VTRASAPESATGQGWPRWVGDVSGAFADLGTFLPLVIGLLVLGAYDASGLLVGFGIFAIATGLLYRRPVPVQPMKAIAALAITGAMTASGVMASGLIIGLVLLVLGVTGLINHLERVVPRTILFGIQLGLGLSLIVTSAGLAGSALWLGLAVLGLLAALQFSGLRAMGCLIVLAGAIVWSLAFGSAPLPGGAIGWNFPSLNGFDLPALQQALETGVLPQLALTVTNAVLLTAALSADYFPQDRHRITARNLTLSSGGLNLLLAPFGAMPMCHGAGGLAAHYSQGARTGLAPVVFGGTCLALGVLAGPGALAWLLLVPMPVIAALLAFAGFQLMNVRRLQALRPTCLAIVGLTALICVFGNVAVGLFVGLLAELARSRLTGARASL
jgi:SulP family sulfate permease